MENKKNFSLYSKPRAPVAPKKPDKTFVVDKSNIICDIPLSSIENFKLANIKLPEGLDLKDLSISVETDDDGNYYSATFLHETVETVEDKLYDKRLKAYNKKHEEYKLKLSSYKLLLKEWEVWKEQKEKEILEKQIEESKKFLVAQGKKVID